VPAGYHPAMDLTLTVTGILEGRTLLSHPLYRRWEEGGLKDGELASYASQYLHVERQLPDTLAATIASTPDGRVRSLLQENLDDELGKPIPHVELFDGFARAVDAVETAPTPATAALVDLYRTAPAVGSAFALGVLAAYEVQAAAIARSKADGLRDHYGLDETATAFWDLHAELEDAHADWTLDAASTLDDAEFVRGVATSRDAWWAFLDDRELAAA